MTTTESHLTLTAGDLIQWYRVERILGQGGFGVTYLATDTNLDHRVAIKEYLPGSLVKRLEDNTLTATSDSTNEQYSEGLQRFLREARTLVKFRHPNIVRVMAVFEANNTAYLVMEYEEGEQFKEYVKRVGGVSEDRLKSLMLSVIDGLDQVHQRGFIHRDIKPVNLIIRKDSSPVLLDFGSTRPVENDLNVQHTSFVSVGYTPLEQYQEGAGLTVGPWTDIYALGATLYYAISGITPVSPISRLAALVKKSKDPLEPAIKIGNGHYSESFLRAIDWALGFKIEDRPQTLSQWRTAFEEKPQSAVPVQPQADSNANDQTDRQPATASRSKLLVRNPELVRKAQPSAKRRSARVLWLAGVIAACLLVAVGGRWFYRDRQQQLVFDQLVERADSAFDGDDMVKEARPLYLQVLDARPENRHAADRLREIDDQLLDRTRAELREGNLGRAETLIGQLESIGESNASALRLELVEKQAKASREQTFTEVQSLLEQRSYQQALGVLTKLGGNASTDDRFAALESSARSGMEAEQRKQAQSVSEQQRRDASRLANQKRVAAANERQRQRRRDYRRYLTNAEQALQSGDITSAREWIDNAGALQINDDELEDMEARIATAESFLTKPLSDYEMSYAREQFNTLERAIEAKNIRAISELTDDESRRRGLFETLFDRYTQISVRVMDLEPKLEPKRVTAVLRIEKMVLPNGDVVYPSSSYRDSALSLDRNRYSWSKIRW